MRPSLGIVLRVVVDVVRSEVAPRRINELLELANDPHGVAP